MSLRGVDPEIEKVLSNRVRDVISYSREEAIRLGHDYIGTEHLLLGLIREGEGIAVKILRNLRCDLLKLKKAIEDTVRSTGGTLTVGNIPFTKQAEKVLKITYLESKLYKSDVIGTEHLLFALLRDDENIAAQILQQGFSITYDAVRAELDAILGGRSTRRTGPAVGEARGPEPAPLSEHPNSPPEQPLPIKEEETSGIELGFDIWLDPGSSSPEEIAELYLALSELHRALGGVGLDFRDDETEVFLSEDHFA